MPLAASKIITFAESGLSDYYKDAYGFRPRNVYPSAMTEKFVKEEFARLEKIIVASIEEGKVQQTHALTALDKAIAATMENFNLDWFTAVRWMLAAEGEVEVDRWLYDWRISAAKRVEYTERYVEARNG